MIKRLLSIVLSLLLCFTVASPCFATQSSDDEIDAALMERGYPADVLASMDISRKLILCEDPRLVYLGSFSINYSESQASNSDTAIQPYGQISTSDLTLSFYVSYVVIDGLLDHIFIQFDYEWHVIKTLSRFLGMKQNSD